MLATVPLEEQIVYPTSDGKPVAESSTHFSELMALIGMLQRLLKDRPDVYVWGNNYVYYEKGVPSSCVSPDAYVVFGVPRGVRESYKTWEEGGHGPSIVFELTSPSTKAEDFGDKMDKYITMGVAEYIMYDPRNEYLNPPLQGNRLKRGEYVPIQPDADGRIYSRELNVDLCLDDAGKLCLLDPVTGVPVLRTVAVEAKLEAELKGESRARRAAETAARREIKARKEAEAQAKRADDEARRESEARKNAEAEIARLREELNRLKNP